MIARSFSVVKRCAFRRIVIAFFSALDVVAGQVGARSNGEKIMADDQPGADSSKRTLMQVHPELGDRSARLNDLLLEAHRARRSGSPLDGAARAEASELLNWVEGLVKEAGFESDRFVAEVQRDEAAFAHAIRFRDDLMVLRQVWAAGEELRRLL